MFTHYRILYSVQYNRVLVTEDCLFPLPGITQLYKLTVHLSQEQTLLDVEPKRINKPGKDESQDRLTCCPVTVFTLVWVEASPTQAFLGTDIYHCLLTQDLCRFHNQYSDSLLLPGSFSPCGTAADLPRGFILPRIQENISDGKKRQLLLHTKNEPSMEILPELTRNPSATACLQRDSLSIKLNFIKCS